MKLSLSIILLAFWLIAAQTAWSQPSMVSIQNIPIRFFTYNAGNYAGEVNSAHHPDGYGECSFGDSLYYIGQFADGLISGEGISLKKGSNSIIIAQWREGQVTGLYFRVKNKALTLCQVVNGLEYSRRICSFVDKGPVASCISGTDSTIATRISFQLNKNELNDATVIYMPQLDNTFFGKGPYLEYSSFTRELNVRLIKNGVYAGTEGSGYGIKDNNLKAIIEKRIGKPLPQWLTEADFWKRDDNDEKFFGAMNDIHLPGGSTTMEYASDEGTNATLRVAKVNNLIAPTGFMQEIHLSEANSYRYILGDIVLSHGATGAHVGTGVVMTCYTNSNSFQVAAGDIIQPENSERVQYLHSGISIDFDGNNYGVALGNWDDQNNLGRGYYFAPGNFMFRGGLKAGSLNGPGDAVKEKGLASKVNFNNNNFTPITQTPIFNPIKAPSLFDHYFNLEF